MSSFEDEVRRAINGLRAAQRYARESQRQIAQASDCAELTRTLAGKDVASKVLSEAIMELGACKQEALKADDAYERAISLLENWLATKS